MKKITAIKKRTLEEQSRKAANNAPNIRLPQQSLAHSRMMFHL